METIDKFCKVCDRKLSKTNKSGRCVNHIDHSINSRRYRTENLQAVREREKIRWLKYKRNRQATYRVFNRDEINRKRRERYIKNNELERYRKKREETAKNYLVIRREKRRIRRSTDMFFRLEHIIRSRIISAIKGKQKSKRTAKLLGCTPLELKSHLEKQFYPHPITNEPMSWDNYGKKWHVDHWYPLSAAIKESLESFEAACHYSNLQPLWAEYNLKKSDTIPL